MIYDLRFMISGRAAGSVEDLGEFDGFALQILNFGRADKACTCGQINPEFGFIRFFYGYTHL